MNKPKATDYTSSLVLADYYLDLGLDRISDQIRHRAKPPLDNWSRTGSMSMSRSRTRTRTRTRSGSMCRSGSRTRSVSMSRTWSRTWSRSRKK